MRRILFFAFLAALYLLMREEGTPDSHVARESHKQSQASSLSDDKTSAGSLAGITEDKQIAIASLPRSASLSDEKDRPNLGVSLEKRQTLLTAKSPDYIYVTGNIVNFRDGPSLNAKRLGSLSKGTKLVLLEEGTKWHKVSGQVNGSAMVGWMSSKYLSYKAVAPEPVPSKKPVRQIAAPTTSEIRAARNAKIRQSIAAYPGSCPCPYNRDRAGRRCGKRSAWSKPGGYNPVCYDSDVSKSRLDSYLARRR